MNFELVDFFSAQNYQARLAQGQQLYEQFFSGRRALMQGTIKDESLVSQIEAIHLSLAEIVGRQRYQIWFKNSARFTLCELPEHASPEAGMASEVHLKISVPNSFMANWIESHFRSEINQAVLSATGSKLKVIFAIEPDLIRTTHDAIRTTINESLKLTQNSSLLRAQSRGLKTKNFNGTELTLDSFVVGSSNELAFNAAKQVIRESVQGGSSAGSVPTFNPLFIHGGYGLGKTHLLRGICNEVAGNCEPGKEMKWLYLSAEDFANQFVLALKTKKLETFRRRIRQADLLAIDDIHFLSSKPSTQEEFLHTFNTINLAGKQIVLASDAHPRQIGQLSEKLVNRFVAGMVAEIRPPDFQTRCEICRRFLESRFKDSKLGILPDQVGGKRHAVPEGVIRYIAENLRRSVRELQGALLKVIAYSSLQNEKITISLAEAVLAAHLERCDPMVHVSDIETVVAGYFGQTVTAIHSAKKDRTISLARHFSMYLIRKHIKMSSCEIGRLLGNKNHATVLLACRKVEQSLAQNEELHWHCPEGNKVAKAKTVLAHLEESLKSSKDY